MCEAFFERQPMKASRLRCRPPARAHHCGAGANPSGALFVPPPRFRCRVHAVEISASGHGWLSLAVKIKRRCRRSTSGGVQGDAGVPPAMGLRNRSVVLARDIVGAGLGKWLGTRGAPGAGGRTHEHTLSSGRARAFSWRSFRRGTLHGLTEVNAREHDGHGLRRPLPTRLTRANTILSPVSYRYLRVQAECSSVGSGLAPRKQSRKARAQTHTHTQTDRQTERER